MHYTSEEDQIFIGIQNQGYGLVNQSEDNQGQGEHHSQNKSQELIFPKKQKTAFLTKERGKNNILINLAVFGTMTLIFTILFMSFLSKKSKRSMMPEEEKNYNLANAVTLVHSSKNGLHCPEKYSFSPVQLSCLKCPKGCIRCQPGIGGSNPCLKCLKQFQLLGDQCIKMCPNQYQNWNGYCLLDQERRFQIKDISVKDNLNTQVPYIIYKPEQEINKLLFLIPPIGNNHLYFSRLKDLSEIADRTGTIIVSISTPVEQISKINPNNYHEQSFFADSLMNNILPLLEDEEIGEIYYVGLGDSVFFVINLFQYMVKNDIYYNQSHQMIFLQTYNIKLISTLRIDQLEQGIVLGYLNGEFDLKHQETQNTTQGEEYNKISKILDAAKEYQNHYSLKAFQDQYSEKLQSEKLEILIFSEKGINSEIIIQDLNLLNPNYLQDVQIEFSQKDDYEKISQFISDQLEDILEQFKDEEIKEQNQDLD